jgi:hypothetical protein
MGDRRGQAARACERRKASMGEEPRKLSMADLESVRVICRTCETALEVPIAKVANTQPNVKCPTCPENSATVLIAENDQLRALAKAIVALQGLQKTDGSNKRFELVVRVKEEPRNARA